MGDGARSRYCYTPLTGSDTRYYTAHLLAAIIVMTLSVIEGHSPIASLFRCDISYLWRVARSLCNCVCVRAYPVAAPPVRDAEDLLPTSNFSLRDDTPP